MFKEELRQLSLIKNEPCVTIIIPTSKLFPLKRSDPLKVKNAVNNASKMLTEKLGKRNSAELINNLKKMSDEVDLIHETEGLGIYISQNISKVIRFPFTVEEKIVIDNKFCIRELVYGSCN